jgi:hypothetical protein
MRELIPPDEGTPLSEDREFMDASDGKLDSEWVEENVERPVA